ncbi:MAG: hypothetical protein KDB53_12750, partial [Planctomycetes bacterium]|nr:hypothetical protein [Planctomycetota bacterium]
CLLARACDRLGLVNDADDIVTRALDMRRGLPVDGRYLEALMLASKTAFARGAPDRAVALAVEALDSSADDRELTDERRMKLLINALTHDPHSPQTDERLAELSDLIDDSSDELSRPLTAEIHQVRSVTSINRGDFASALADATRARDLKLSFGSHPAHVVPETALIAYCQRRLGRVSEAIREARQGLADARGLLHPDHPVFRDLEAILGNALFAADHRDDAEPHLARAAELSGSWEKPSKASTEALYHLGILRDSQGRIEESIEAHQRAVQHALESSGKNSSDRGLNLALWGRGLRKDDRPTEALPHLLEAARILEDWMVDGDLRGFFLRQDLAPCLEAGGRHAEAAREWQAIARTAAMLERWKPYVNRWLLRAAQAFERAGDDESAKRLRDLVPDPQDERNDG